MIMCLLILNMIMNVFIIINIIDIKKKMYGYKQERFINDLEEDDEFNEEIYEEENNESDDELSDDYIDDEYEEVEEYYEPDIEEEVVYDKYNDESKYLKCINPYKYYGTFKDTNDFINYVSMHNLKIIDIINRQIRIVKYLEYRTYNSGEKLIIIFDDNTEAVFKPYLFTKYVDVFSDAA